MTVTAQKMKFSIKDYFSKYDQIRRKLRIRVLDKELLKAITQIHLENIAK